MERDLTAREECASWAHVADVRLKLGHEVRVAVVDNGHGPRIDAREYVTADAYDPSKPVTRRTRGRQASGYVGPTRKGLWLTLGQAVELAQAIFAAAEVAETIEGSEAA